MIPINQIKKVCQNPATYSSAGFIDRIHLRMSIYFTWVFVNMGISANKITILSGILCLIGGVLLASESIILFFIGVLCFNFFPVLDCCDGHVARYNNNSTMYGRFLDWYMVFILDATMFVGLSIGVLSYNFSKLLFICSLFTVLTPLLIKSVLTGGWTAICWERLDVLSGKKLPFLNDKAKAIDQSNELTKSNTIPWQNRIKTFINIIITASFSSLAPIVLFVLSLFQILINKYFMSNIDFRPYLIYYIGLIGPIYCLLLLRKRFVENSFEDGYTRLFDNPKLIQLPRHYFF